MTFNEVLVAIVTLTISSVYVIRSLWQRHQFTCTKEKMNGGEIAAAEYCDSDREASTDMSSLMNVDGILCYESWW